MTAASTSPSIYLGVPISIFAVTNNPIFAADTEYLFSEVFKGFYPVEKFAVTRKLGNRKARIFPTNNIGNHMSVFVKFNIQLFFDSSMSYTEAFSDLKNIVDELRFEATPRG